MSITNGAKLWFNPTFAQQTALLEAARLVRSVMDTLDLSSEVCSCCNRTNFNNWSAAQTHKELQSIANKLSRFGGGSNVSRSA